MKTESPFVLSRFEYEPRHLYYLPQAVFAQLENAKPSYLIGTRGTGKTTLLQALHWSERTGNEILVHELGDKPFAKHYIGLYLKLPDTQLQAVDEWLQSATAGQRGIVLGIYIDLLWLELLLDSLAELTVAGFLSASASAEQVCVEKTLKIFHTHYGTQAQSFTAKAPRTFIELAHVFRSGRRTLERHAFAGSSPASAMDGIPIEQVGTFGRTVAASLATFCDEADGEDGEPWHFKICMDEAEVLTEFQVRVLNTMIRLSEAPVFHVLSFVAPPPSATATLLPDLTLSDADRQLVILDEMTDTSFKELTQGVANVRVRARLGPDADEFDLRRCLGGLDINGTLESILKSSVDPEAKRLLAAAKELQSQAAFKGIAPDDDESADADSPPIYQTYLVQQLGLRPPDPGPDWKRRNEDSSKFRKRMVAAYLTICREFNAEVRYYSAEMMLRMSDRCIRDFLAFMHEIFVEASLPLQEFLKRTISAEVQNTAIKRASKNKRATIAERGVSAPTETGRLIDALARITQIVQTEGSDKQHLRVSERGIFLLPLPPKADPQLDHLLTLVSDAGETGFLRVIETESAAWRFRVHKSLAPAYGFSYRGAYYSCRVAAADLVPLLMMTDQKLFTAAVKNLGARLAGMIPPETEEEKAQPPEATLFEGLQ